MMTIAIFLDSFHIGGVQKVFITLANEWKKMGYNPFIITIDGSGELKEDLDESIEIIDLKVPRLIKSFWLIPRVLKKKNVEILLTAKDGVNVFFILNKIFYRYSTRLFVSQHNYLVPEKQSSKGTYNRFLLNAMRFLYNKADGIICVSNRIKNEIIKLGIKDKNIYVVHNPLDIKRVRNLAKEKISDYGNYLVFCGRLSPIKNLDYLLRSFKLFLHYKPSFKLLLVGNGSEMENIKNRVDLLGITDNVLFVGSVSNPYPYISSSSLVVLTSFNEAFPMIVLESLALGKTVVSTSSGGPNEILLPDKGYIVDSFNDEKLFSESLIHALNNPIPSDELVNISKTFSVEEIASLYIHIFDILSD